MSQNNQVEQPVETNNIYQAMANVMLDIEAIAVSESWKDKAGQKQERTEWINVVIFGKLAEIAGQYLTKGTLVWFEGKIRTKNIKISKALINIPLKFMQMVCNY